MQCAWGYLASKDPTLLSCVEHGVRFLLEHHKSASGGYAWELEVTGSGEVHRRDETNRESASRGRVLPITPYTHNHASPGTRELRVCVCDLCVRPRSLLRRRGCPGAARRGRRNVVVETVGACSVALCVLLVAWVPRPLPDSRCFCVL